MISSKSESIALLKSIIEKIEAGDYLVQSIENEESFNKTMAGEDTWSMVDVRMKIRRIA